MADANNVPVGLYPQPGIEVPSDETHTNVSKKGFMGLPAYASRLISIKNASGKHTKTRKYVNYRLGQRNSVKKTKHEGEVYRALQRFPEFSRHFLPFEGANSGVEWAYVNFKKTDTEDLIDIINEMQTANSLDMGYLRKIAKQIFEGLEFLSRKGWIHGDIKVDNVLVEGDKAYVIDLADAKKDPSERLIEKDVEDVMAMLIDGFRISKSEIDPLFKGPVENMDDLVKFYERLVAHFGSSRGGGKRSVRIRTRKNRSRK